MKKRQRWLIMIRVRSTLDMYKGLDRYGEPYLVGRLGSIGIRNPYLTKRGAAQRADSINAHGGDQRAQVVPIRTRQ